MASKTTDEEVINHYGLVRLRVNGAANLQMSLYSLGETQEAVITPFYISTPTNIEPTRLVNFTQQRASLEIMTTEIGENFQISKIIIFARAVAASFPGN